MIRRTFRFGLLVGLAGAAAAALAKVFGRSERLAPATTAPETPWPRLTTDPTRPAAGTAHPTLVPDPAAPSTTWVQPSGAVCPTSHPVKAKLSSKIFHLPGMLNYERTNPDRCYADQASAEADGLRIAKR